MHAQASLYTSADHRCGHAKIYELQLDVWHLSLLYIGPYDIKHCCCDLVLYKASSENWGGNHTLIHMLVIKTRPKWKAPTAAGTARLSWDALWRPLAAVQEYQNDPPSLELQVSGFMPHHFPVSCISVCVCVFCRFCLLPHVWLSVQSPSAHVGEPFHGEYPSTKCTLGALIGSSRQFSVNCDGILSKPGCCSHPASLVFAGECLPQSGDVKKSFHLTPRFPTPSLSLWELKEELLPFQCLWSIFTPHPPPSGEGRASTPPSLPYLSLFTCFWRGKTEKQTKMRECSSQNPCLYVQECRPAVFVPRDVRQKVFVCQ